MNTISNDEQQDPIRKAVNATADELAAVLRDKHKLFAELCVELRTVIESESMPWHVRDRAKLLLKRCERFL